MRDKKVRARSRVNEFIRSGDLQVAMAARRAAQAAWTARRRAALAVAT